MTDQEFVLAALLATRTEGVGIVCAGRYEIPDETPVRLRWARMRGLSVARVAKGASTREEAEEAVEWAVAEAIRDLTIVTSGYHLPRAFLTFLEAARGVLDAPTIWTLAVPSTLDKLSAEWEKITRYQARGDCASWHYAANYVRTR